jgi:hypothetical protein
LDDLGGSWLLWGQSASKIARGLSTRASGEGLADFADAVEAADQRLARLQVPPTDCPQRERAGWTGDFQLFLPAAAFLYDVAGFATKWLRDVVADQWDDGTVANMSPCPPAEGRDSPMAHLNGSAGWGDAVVIVPWELYRTYGDERILAEMWPSMTAWLDRATRIARE